MMDPALFDYGTDRAIKAAVVIWSLSAVLCKVSAVRCPLTETRQTRRATKVHHGPVDPAAVGSGRCIRLGVSEPPAPSLTARTRRTALRGDPGSPIRAMSGAFSRSKR